MTAPACAAGCKRPSPSATLCTECTRELAQALIQAANISGDLDDAVAKRLTRGTGGPRGSEVPLPYDEAAGKASDALWAVLAEWVRAVARPGESWPQRNTIGGAANWLAVRLDVIRQHPDGGEAHRGILAAVHRAVTVVDRLPERLYAGPCPHCGTDLLGKPGASVIKCACGTVSDVRQQRDVMGDALWDTLGTVQWCITAASALGVTLSEHTVRTWVKRSKLAKHGERPAAFGGTAQAVYRFGDVMKLAAERPVRTRITSV